MTNNDIIRRIRYTFDFSNPKIVSLFGLADLEVTQEQIINWLRKEDDPEYQNFSDAKLAIFLNGLIIDKRGKKDGLQPVPEKKINNNIIFSKIKIALNLKSEDVLGILALANMKISNHELSAFFRRSDHKHFRECKDQILRNFLNGIQIKYRGN